MRTLLFSFYSYIAQYILIRLVTGNAINHCPATTASRKRENSNAYPLEVFRPGQKLLPDETPFPCRNCDIWEDQRYFVNGSAVYQIVDPIKALPAGPATKTCSDKPPCPVDSTDLDLFMEFNQNYTTTLSVCQHYHHKQNNESMRVIFYGGSATGGYSIM